MTLNPSNPRTKPRWLAAIGAVGLLTVLAAGLVLAGAASDSKFEGADGNLANDNLYGAGTVDWNDFGTPAWNGTSPYRTATATFGGWSFTGLEDAQNSGTDTVFAGGTKQDDNCAKVQDGPKPPNKDDLKRIYIASRRDAGNNHTYLALAWARIPQNTTSASAHVAFEFNQNDPQTTPCPTTDSDGLVPRSVANGGDMLIVYDFEGGSDPAILKLLRWKDNVTAAGELCDASGKAPTTAGCWVFQVGLTAGGFADAKVNTTDASDTVAPGGTDTLETQEFGEAIIDLTDAGVFPANPQAGQCTSFGRMFAVSRSSGNSSQAQMKDLVGPGDVELSNCGGLTIEKDAIPNDAQDFSFTTSASLGVTGNAFTLDDDGTNTGTGGDIKNTATFASVLAGTHYVTEDTETGWVLTNIACTNTTGSTIQIGTGTGAGFVGDGDFDAGDTTVKIVLGIGSSPSCKFTNTKNGSIKIVKNAVPDDTTLFSFTKGGDFSGTFSLEDDGDETDANKKDITIGSLQPGTFYVAEDTETGWVLTNITCSNAGTSTIQIGTGTGAGFTGDGDFDAGDTTVKIVLAAGSTPECTFTNSAQYRAIVLVCNQATLDLYGSEVSLDGGAAKPTIEEGDLVLTALTDEGYTGTTDQLMEYLCGLGGAQFDNLDPNPSPADPYSLSLVIPTPS
jgi:hypothetical protein